MTDKIFMFDVDGTLTDARRTIVPQFKEFMFDFRGPLRILHCCLNLACFRFNVFQRKY